MRLYHTTPRSNLENIQREGIDPTRSEGAEAVIWLHTPSRSHWAILHTAKRHNCNVDDIVVIAVNIPRSKLRRRWRGLWTTDLKITSMGQGFLCEGFQRKRYHFVLPFRLNKMLAPSQKLFQITDARLFSESPIT